ncbi:unnamed protein product [Candidula unifasciata]|uniref:Uncharacterized protein n=1 Tax=Candidula unifasciata TaxID=100452 RepID=A0A8S3Z2P4_9EUPU|nr:unnamed protein product [Candidula unifasciata]
MPDLMADTARDVQKQRESLVKETSSRETSSKGDDKITVTKWFSSLQERMQDREYKSNLLHSWLISLSFLTLWARLVLQIITGTDLEGASAFLTGFTAGYMAGSLFSGVVFNKVKTRLLFVTGLSGCGAVSIIAPYCSQYTLMIFIQTLIGFFAGAVDTSGNTWHMKMWRSEGNVLMQIIHFSFAFGGVLAPLYTEPFLAQRMMENETSTRNVTVGNSSQLEHVSIPQTTDVKHAYLISGILMVLASIPFGILFIKHRSFKLQSSPKQTANVKITYRQLPCCLHVLIITTVCGILMVYCCVELTFASYLMPFLINEYDSMTKSESVYLMTVFWISFAISRFIMIFASKVLASVQLLSLCLLLMIIACVGFMISAMYQVVPAIAVFTALAGLGMSGVFPAAFSWAETELLKVTARVSSSISISASSGKIFIPLIMGFLMEKVSNMWFCYILICQTAIVCLLFIFLLMFNRLYINRVYGTVTLLEQNVGDNGQNQCSITQVQGEQETLVVESLNTSL